MYVVVSSQCRDSKLKNFVMAVWYLPSAVDVHIRLVLMAAEQDLVCDVVMSHEATFFVLRFWKGCFFLFSFILLSFSD